MTVLLIPHPALVVEVSRGLEADLIPVDAVEIINETTGPTVRFLDAEGRDIFAEFVSPRFRVLERSEVEA